MKTNYKNILIIVSVVIFLVGLGSLFFIHKRTTERINQINNQSYTLPKLVGPTSKELRDYQKDGTYRLDGAVYPEHGQIYVYCDFDLPQKYLNAFSKTVDIPLLKTNQKNRAQIVITDNDIKSLEYVNIDNGSSSGLLRQAHVEINRRKTIKSKNNLPTEICAGIGYALGLSFNNNRRSIMYRYDDHKGTPVFTDKEITQMYDDYNSIIFAK